MNPDCPFESVDLLGASYTRDPYHLLARARAERPVFFAEQYGLWVVTSYDLVKSVLRDTETYSSANAQRPVQPYCDAARAALDAGGFGAVPSLTSLDPPAHTRLRKAYGSVSAFSPARMDMLREWVASQVDLLIDGFICKGKADLVAELTAPLPARVVYRLVGFPDVDAEQLQRWAETRLELNFGRPDPQRQVEIAERLVAFWRYTEGFVAKRLTDPQEDYASDLVRIHLENPQTLTLPELTSFVYGLSVAGQETTVNSMGSMLRLLLQDRSQWEQLVAEPDLARNAVEETLRLEPPILAWRRVTTRDASLGGVALPAGSQLLLHLGSAGHDSAQFPDGETLDIRRRNAAGHLAFGFGAHYCLGNAMARMESVLVLEGLVRRMPSLRLTPGQQFEYPALLSFRGPRALLAQWDV